MLKQQGRQVYTVPIVPCMDCNHMDDMESASLRIEILAF